MIREIVPIAFPLPIAHVYDGKNKVLHFLCANESNVIS